MGCRTGASSIQMRRLYRPAPRVHTRVRTPALQGQRAVRDLKRSGRLWRFPRLRQRKYLNSIVEQDHRRTKRLVRPALGFGSPRTSSPRTSRRTLAGYEAMAMIGRGQPRSVGRRDMQAQAALVAGLFGTAA